MTKKSLIVVLALCLLAALAVWAARLLVGNRAARVPGPAERRTARVGEKIEYDVRLGGIKLGTAVFTQMQNSPLGDVEANVYVFETKMLRFSDTEKIFSDPVSYLPLRVERDISAWPRKEKIIEEYDQNSFTVTLNKNGKREEIKSGGPLQNAVLLPFFLRECGRIEPGWRMKVNLPTQKFTIIYRGEEKVRVPAGEFAAFRFTSEPEKFEVWVTADEARVPLKIKGTGAIGYILVMSGYTSPAAGQGKE